jgi:hypothetical protein
MGFKDCEGLSVVFRNWEVDKVLLMLSIIEIGISIVPLELTSSMSIETCFYSVRER